MRTIKNAFFKRSGYCRGWFFAALLACLCSPVSFAADVCENPSRLYFSVVPEGGGQRDLKRFKPLLVRISKETGKSIEAVRAHSYGMVIEGLLGGAVDFAMLGPASYIAAHRVDPTVLPVAIMARKGSVFQKEGAFYYSYLITAQKKNLKTNDDLRGASLAMVDPHSTSGSLIPQRYFAKQANLDLKKHFGHIAYSGSHPKSIMGVVEGRYDAAFVASMRLSELFKVGKFKERDVRIMWRSPPIPIDPLVLRGNLCKPLAEKIRAVVLDSSHPSNQKTLKAFGATRFVPVSDKDYDIVRELGK